MHLKCINKIRIYKYVVLRNKSRALQVSDTSQLTFIHEYIVSVIQCTVCHELQNNLKTICVNILGHVLLQNKPP